MKGVDADMTWVATSTHTGTVQSEHAPWQEFYRHLLLGSPLHGAPDIETQLEPVSKLGLYLMVVVVAGVVVDSCSSFSLSYINFKEVFE